MRIIYLGTPDFAVESLDILVRNDYQVVAVVTMPDKPAGRGHKLQFSPVKKYALEKDIPLLQPSSLKDEQFIEELKSFEADVQVVVAFRMLPEVVWNMPRLGTINVHASLLPQYRGAAPINHAVMNGETETGVSTFRLQHEIDTGGILLQKKTPILLDDTAGIVHDKLMYLGAEALLETIRRLEDGTLDEVPQDTMIDEDTPLKKAPKIFKEDCKVDWNQSAEHIHNKIRGLSPYPAAFCQIQNGDAPPVNLKLFVSSLDTSMPPQSPGTLVIHQQKGELSVACLDGWINIHELQMAGKRRMKTEDFLRGINNSSQYKML